MSGVKRWRDTDHLDRAVKTAGGREAYDAAVGAMLDEARGWRLAELRKRREMTQEQVASRMGVSVARVSQIEAGSVSISAVRIALLVPSSSPCLRCSSSKLVSSPLTKPNRRRTSTSCGSFDAGLVEPPRQRCPPVEHHGLAGGVCDVSASDVELAVVDVEASEEQGCVGVVGEFGDAVGHVPAERFGGVRVAGNFVPGGEEVFGAFAHPAECFS
ncbi:hypothetical protein GCM10010199_48050 [Dactylosporangium roseum]